MCKKLPKHKCRRLWAGGRGLKLFDQDLKKLFTITIYIKIIGLLYLLWINRVNVDKEGTILHKSLKNIVSFMICRKCAENHQRRQNTGTDDEVRLPFKVTPDAKSTGKKMKNVDSEAEAVCSMICWTPNDGYKLHFHTKTIEACSGASIKKKRWTQRWTHLPVPGGSSPYGDRRVGRPVVKKHTRSQNVLHWSATDGSVVYGVQQSQTEAMFGTELTLHRSCSVCKTCVWPWRAVQCI